MGKVLKFPIMRMIEEARRAELEILAIRQAGPGK